MENRFLLVQALGWSRVPLTWQDIFVTEKSESCELPTDSWSGKAGAASGTAGRAVHIASFFLTWACVTALLIILAHQVIIVLLMSFINYTSESLTLTSKFLF